MMLQPVDKLTDTQEPTEADKYAHLSEEPSKLLPTLPAGTQTNVQLSAILSDKRMRAQLSLYSLLLSRASLDNKPSRWIKPD
jgi:hypothetical protein